jgi:wyosine [tRNA(Phe)-imidazoG37] synthetase (radical SAM superfamily)
MSNVFGPVPSRRLGRSLGIDPVPLKTCNWNCVYCQLGRSTPVVHERSELIPRASIIADFDRWLAANDDASIDWVTFVGSGETTLHPGLGWLIQEVKRRTERPVAVITNGSLLWDAAVSEELLAADAVLPSLDAGTSELYRRINRPHPSLTFERHVEGLATFAEAYTGRLWLEVMLMDGWNDDERSLADLAEVIDRIKPDEAHLVTPTRPAAENSAWAPSEARIARALVVLGAVARVAPPQATGFGSASETADAAHLRESLLEEIGEIIQRHPMREVEIIEMATSRGESAVAELLEQLATSGRGRRIWLGAATFWTKREADRFSP